METKKITPQERYDKANTTQVKMKLHNTNDSDILNFLNKQGNKQGTIKAALREYMKKIEQ